MSSLISKINTLWRRFSSKGFRHSFAEHAVSDRLAAQLYAMRAQRGWTQAEVSERTGMAQSRISKLEGDCHKVTLETLRRFARAYDVALEVRFVPFSKLLVSTSEIVDRPVAGYEDDKSPAELWIDAKTWAQVE